MRRSAFAIVALLALVVAGGAIAKFTQVASIKLTATRGGHSTGISANISATDPAVHQPKRATKLSIRFPTNTRFNLGTPLRSTCRLTDKQLTAPFAPACPARSQIGTGTAVANALALAPALKAKVTAYVGGSHTIILVIIPDQKAIPGAPTFVLRASAYGSWLTIPIPRIVVGKGPGFNGITVALVSLKLTTTTLGSGSSALVTAGRCQAGKFTVQSHFQYADGSKLSLTSSSACK